MPQVQKLLRSKIWEWNVRVELSHRHFVADWNIKASVNSPLGRCSFLRMLRAQISRALAPPPWGEGVIPWVREQCHMFPRGLGGGGRGFFYLPCSLRVLCQLRLFITFNPSLLCTPCLFPLVGLSHLFGRLPHLTPQLAAFFGSVVAGSFSLPSFLTWVLVMLAFSSSQTLPSSSRSPCTAYEGGRE
jgi:hypothetical protein